LWLLLPCWHCWLLPQPTISRGKSACLLDAVRTALPLETGWSACMSSCRVTLAQHDERLHAPPGCLKQFCCVSPLPQF
jgi:hypothetical protein